MVAQADALRALAHGVSVDGPINSPNSPSASTWQYDEGACAEVHSEHAGCAAVLATLRDRPELLALGLDRAHALRGRGCAESEAEAASQLLLCSVYGGARHHSRDARGVVDLVGAITERLCLRCDDGGGGGGGDGESDGASRLMAGGLLPRLISAHLRNIPGGVAWLTETVGPHIERVLVASDVGDDSTAAAENGGGGGRVGGLRLDTDPMEAYCCLPDEVRAEVDRDVARGEVRCTAEMHAEIHAEMHAEIHAEILHR